MTLWQRIRQTLGSGQQADDEISRELQSHMEMREEQLIGQGLAPAEARREARRQFGNHLKIQEETRSVDLFPALEAAQRDIKQAIRGLSSRPGLVGVAVASLALGIGANAVMFSAMDAVFWKPLPLPEPERLLEIRAQRNGDVSNGNPARTRDYHQRLTTVEGVGGYYGESAILPGENGPQRVAGYRTVGPVMKIVKLEPVLGRRFTEAEERGETPVAILTDSFWKSHFSADPGVIGRPLVTSTSTYTVIGILPARAVYPKDVDFWAPAARELQGENRAASFLGVVARMKPGVTPGQVEAELKTLHAALAAQYPDTDQGLTGRAAPLGDSIAPQARLPLLAAWAAVAVVLLIACLNIASLLLARGMERAREATIRAALGASRWALVRTFLAESAALAAAGGGLGLLLAAWGIDIVAGFLPSDNRVTLDYRVVLFSLLLAVACAVLFGLVPAWQTAQTGLAGRLNELSRASSSSRRLWWRGAMVVAQTALSLVLLGGAGLLLASFENQRRAPLGFTPAQLVAARVKLTWDTPTEKLHGFTRTALERLQAVPGVEAVAMADRLPLEGNSQTGEIVLRGRELPPVLAKLTVNNRTVSSGYFATLGVPLVRGRMFEGRPNVPEAVVNQTFARTFFGTEDPVGRQFAQARGKRDEYRWVTITGVVRDLRFRPDAAEAAPEFYRSFEQNYWPELTFVARSPLPPGQLAAGIRTAIAQVDANQIVENVDSVEDQLAGTLDTPRRMMQVTVAFALLALGLALIGLYGVMASDVQQRRRELGIRLALGATRGEVLRQSLVRGAKLAGLGVALGVVASLLTQRLMGDLLYGVAPGDLRWLGAAAFLLLAAALIAALRPAWVGASLDPAMTLRHE
jgi:putative ABC transport system permease protein